MNGFFMKRPVKKQQNKSKKSRQLMVEEIDSQFDETTPEKMVMKKDKKFRPQRMA